MPDDLDDVGPPDSDLFDRQQEMNGFVHRWVAKNRPDHQHDATFRQVLRDTILAAPIPRRTHGDMKAYLALLDVQRSIAARVAAENIPLK